LEKTTRKRVNGKMDGMPILKGNVGNDRGKTNAATARWMRVQRRILTRESKEVGGYRRRKGNAAEAQPIT